MAYVEDRPNRRPTFSDEARALATEWRKLTRAATYVAVFTSPATFTFLMLRHDWPLGWALLVTFLSVIAFRGLVDVLAHRFPTGEQLVAVTGGPLQLQNLPVKIAIRKSAADGGDISLRDGPGVLYRLCGLGPKCALDRGKPAPERHLLLRREALELALYSFHDLDNVQDVVVFMPPTKGKEATQALHFRRGDVAGQLARPLRATLTPPAPTPDTVAKWPDARFVQNLTVANLFKFSFTQSQDASVFLVLDPQPQAS